MKTRSFLFTLLVTAFLATSCGNYSTHRGMGCYSYEQPEMQLQTTKFYKSETSLNQMNDNILPQEEDCLTSD